MHCEVLDAVSRVETFACEWTPVAIEFQIAQYQIANIAKHSIAKKASIKIDRLKEKFRLTINDNGKGIDLKTIQFGKGFANIQEKTDAFDGSFSLESLAGKAGFKVEVII